MGKNHNTTPSKTKRKIIKTLVGEVGNCRFSSFETADACFRVELIVPVSNRAGYVPITRPIHTVSFLNYLLNRRETKRRHEAFVNPQGL
jgi:hypothetical protein